MAKHNAFGEWRKLRLQEMKLSADAVHVDQLAKARILVRVREVRGHLQGLNDARSQYRCQKARALSMKA